MFMNYYTIIFRLDSDNRFSKRYWEGFSSSRETVMDDLADYCRQSLFGGQGVLFPCKIIIIRLDEYLSVFK